MCIHVAPGEIPDHAGQTIHFFSLCLGTSLHYDMHQDARQLHRPGPPSGTGHASHLSCNSLVIKKHVLFSCRRVILPYHAHLPACLLLACLISSTHLPRHAFNPPSPSYLQSTALLCLFISACQLSSRCLVLHAPSYHQHRHLMLFLQGSAGGGRMCILTSTEPAVPYQVLHSH